MHPNNRPVYLLLTVRQIIALFAGIRKAYGGKAPKNLCVLLESEIICENPDASRVDENKITVTVCGRSVTFKL